MRILHTLISAIMQAKLRQLSTGGKVHVQLGHVHLSAPVCLQHNRERVKCSAKRKPSENPEQETGADLKALWYAAEAFGKAVGSSAATDTKKTDSNSNNAPQALTRQQIIDSIRADYDSNYFISGVGDMHAYADDCEFADPFVSFKGTQRFKQNVSNFGGLLQDVKLDVYEFNELAEDRVQTRWRFSCILDLPWKPLLAAAGNTTHVMDLQKGVVVKHIENWEVEPKKVVAQLFRPAAKLPTTAWETFMMSAGEGDVKGVWMVLSPTFLKLSAPIAAVSLLFKLFTAAIAMLIQSVGPQSHGVTLPVAHLNQPAGVPDARPNDAGEGLPGVALDALEGVSWLLFISAAVTEVYKLLTLTESVERGAR